MKLGEIARAAAVVAAAVVTTAPATAAPPSLPRVPGTGVVFADSQPDFRWNGAYQAAPVQFPSRRSEATLAGTLYGPTDVASAGALPAVVVIPPSSGAATQGSVSYLAKFLAANGFVAITVDPQGVGNSETLGDPACDGTPGRTNPSPCPNVPYQQMDNFFDAGQSALDFLLSPADPWLAHVDPARVGATGHSEGARAATYLQDPAFDGRVRAVVALDNLTTNVCGDAGTPSNEVPGGQTGVQNALINGEPYCLVNPSHPQSIDNPDQDPAFTVRPVAPAAGLASDGPGGFGSNDPTGITQGSPDEKKAAFDAWRAAGVPSMELVLAGVSHLQFTQSSASNEDLLHRIAIYTDAWLARWLLPDPAQDATLTACDVLGEPMRTFLSSSYRSAVFIPGTDIADFRAACV